MPIAQTFGGKSFGSGVGESSVGKTGGTIKDTGKEVGPVGGGVGGGGKTDPVEEPSISPVKLTSGGLSIITARRNIFDFGMARIQVQSAGTSTKTFSVQSKTGMSLLNVKVASCGPVGFSGGGAVATIGPFAGRGSGTRTGYIVADITLKPGIYTISDGTDTQQVRVYSRSRFAVQNRNSTAALGPNSETNFLPGTDTEPTETASPGKGLVNQRRTKNVRSFARPNKGSVRIVTKTPKQS